MQCLWQIFQDQGQVYHNRTYWGYSEHVYVSITKGFWPAFWSLELITCVCIILIELGTSGLQNGRKQGMIRAFPLASHSSHPWIPWYMVGTLFRLWIFTIETAKLSLSSSVCRVVHQSRHALTLTYWKRWCWPASYQCLSSMQQVQESMSIRMYWVPDTINFYGRLRSSRLSLQKRGGQETKVQFGMTNWPIYSSAPDFVSFTCISATHVTLNKSDVSKSITWSYFKSHSVHYMYVDSAHFTKTNGCFGWVGNLVYQFLCIIYMVS